MNEDNELHEILTKHNYKADTKSSYSRQDKNSTHIVKLHGKGVWSHLAPSNKRVLKQGAKELGEHLDTIHSTQHTEEETEQFDETPYNVRASKHHKRLKKKGFRYTGTSGGGWTAHYKTGGGREAKIEFNHSNDTHGTLYRKKDSGQYEEVDWEDWDLEDELEEQYEELNEETPVDNKPVRKKPIANRGIRKLSYLEQLKRGAKPGYGHSFGRP